MARYEHLPIYKQAMDVAVHVEKVVAGCSRSHKHTLGTGLGSRTFIPWPTLGVGQRPRGKRFGRGECPVRRGLLTRRFGVLPRWAVQRLDAAALEQLDGWLEGIFEAQSLEDLLGPKPRRGVPKAR
ncbi:MAG TPA: hypothetical protein VES73_06275 [Lamprocystis sp. (in: g-proteobacteria)]|nr:hypothetical protein [Lamprocystis sp. (in: g-proteobacteria)]